MTRLADFLNRRVPEGWTPERLDAAIRVAVYDLYTPRAANVRDIIPIKSLAERVGVPQYIIENAISNHGALREAKYRTVRTCRVGDHRVLIIEDPSRVTSVATDCPHCGTFAKRCSMDTPHGRTICAKTGKELSE